jgi:hypothetical protein
VTLPHEPPDSAPNSYPEWYYELLARTMGEAKADWARLPRHEREVELTLLHRSFDTPDDLSVWPAELDGGAERP